MFAPLIVSLLACLPEQRAPTRIEAPSVEVHGELQIVDRPIPFGARRRSLTLAYLNAHVDPTLRSIALEPRAIVLHWTALPTFEASHAAFVPTELADRPELSGAGRVNVSAHFLIDRDGTVARLMPEDLVGRHTIGLNHVAIGVENVGSASEPPTEAQVEANAALVRHLASRHPITHLLGHHEYRRMEGHPYFRELDPGYRTTKHDPGDAFMASVRDRIADLGLSAPP